MAIWEYKVVPAPRRGVKIKGAKTTEDRFAAALSEVMNSLGAEGWDYLRADMLPVDERSGLTGSKTSYQNLLVFRRERPAAPMDQSGHPAPPGRPFTLPGAAAEPSVPETLPETLQDQSADGAPAQADSAALGSANSAPSPAVPPLGPARRD